MNIGILDFINKHKPERMNNENAYTYSNAFRRIEYAQNIMHMNIRDELLTDGSSDTKLLYQFITTYMLDHMTGYSVNNNGVLLMIEHDVIENPDKKYLEGLTKIEHMYNLDDYELYDDLSDYKYGLELGCAYALTPEVVENVIHTAMKELNISDISDEDMSLLILSFIDYLHSDDDDILEELLGIITDDNYTKEDLHEFISIVHEAYDEI